MIASHENVYKLDPDNDPAGNDDREEGSAVDFAMVIERLDQDRRESELRIANSQERLEQRLANSIELMEQRMTEERRLSEERTEKRVSQMEERMDRRLGEAMSSIESVKTGFETVKWWILAVGLTTVVGISAMIVTVVLS